VALDLIDIWLIHCYIDDLLLFIHK
jgi:hypothetical protein